MNSMSVCERGKVADEVTDSLEVRRLSRSGLASKIGDKEVSSTNRYETRTSP